MPQIGYDGMLQELRARVLISLLGSLTGKFAEVLASLWPHALL